MANTNVYSYHTFYFPFIWNNAGSVSFDSYINSFNDTKWKNISISSFENMKNVTEQGMDYPKTYQTMQYFTEAAKESIFGWDKNYVKYYSYDDATIHEKAEYHIEKGEKTYDLKLNAIKLKIFNTGVGILIFETENRDYRTLDDIKNINEYGRRIFPPYTAPGGCGSCADRLGISAICEYSILSTSDAAVLPLTEDECIPAFIRSLLPGDSIKPAIDDRMFVACLINDPLLFKELFDYDAQTNSLKTISELSDQTSESLYELIYIDTSGNCSCPTKSMRDELLNKSIYKRWIEGRAYGKIAGTFHAVTHHSFIAVTTAPEEYMIERPFLTQYTHLVSTVLAQRAAIIAFDAISSKFSEGFDSRNGKRLSTKSIKKLMSFQQKYIAFLNQHNNIEITCQEQGVELYEMLQREMYVKENADKLSKEIELLSETANTSNDVRINKIAIIFTVIFGLLALFEKPIEALWEPVLSYIRFLLSH